MNIHELALLLIVLCVIDNTAMSSPIPDSTTSPGQQAALDGTFLFDLGTNVSSPLLRLIGKTFQRYDDERKATEQRLNGPNAVEQRLADEIKAVEKRLTDTLCERHPCAEWESWTTCTVGSQGQFGVRSRSRDCNNARKLCSSVDTSNLPTMERGVCEGSGAVNGGCPAGYNYTGGYCLKLYNTQTMTQSDAQAACQQDGGHLVNVNTKAKSDVMHAILKTQGITNERVWIDGKRTQQAGDWHYTYGAVPDFDNWYSSEPSNGSSELCKVDNNSARKWYDRECTSAYWFVCEVV